MSGNNLETPAEGLGQSRLSHLARQYALTVMAQHTFEEAVKQKLICDVQDEETGRSMLQGVAFRASKGEYASYPTEQPEISPWIASLGVLNVGVSGARAKHAEIVV